MSAAGVHTAGTHAAGTNQAGIRAAGVYVHIPFCVRKCRYCDFNSQAIDAPLASRYVEALIEDIPRARSRFGFARGRASTLYLGGGTPTTLKPGDLARIVRACASEFGLGDGAEVTVEVNPGTVDRRSLETLRASGVNRLSVGAQSFDDDILMRIGRIHSAGEVHKTIRDARQSGFTNINLDLIFGLPGQGLASWKATLETAMTLGPEHLSLYPLELEESTPLFHEVTSGRTELPSEDDVVEMWETAISVTQAAGYRRYEISNYAREGFECRHNLIYWLNGEYVGIGAGACSHVAGRRHYNVRTAAGYCEAVEAGQDPRLQGEAGEESDEMVETVIMGLRLADGLSLRGFRERFGVDLDEAFPGVAAKLAGIGLVETSEDRIRLTERGLFLANAVFREFVGRPVS